MNIVLARRDSVTVGTDDDGPGLRLAVVGYERLVTAQAGWDHIMRGQAVRILANAETAGRPA